MNFFELLSQSLLTPAILFFLTGIIIGLLKTDLHIPESVSKFLSLYLIVALGLKGGHALAITPFFNPGMILLICIGISFSFLLPFIAYFFLKHTTKLDLSTASALAAHYGSVSIITFVTAGSFLKAEGLQYAGYLIAVLTAMEAPAIFSGVYLAFKHNNSREHTLSLWQTVASSGCLLLLFASFIIGWITGEPGFASIKYFFDLPFQGMLCFFLLDMGLLVASQLEYIKQFTWQLVCFGIYMPLIGATLALITAYSMRLDLGTGTMFMVLCASASYIAVPAAMRMAIPQAKAGIYVPMSLAITFPFNILVGIPLYFRIAQLILK
jgi:uncharacterized protein